MNGTYYPSAKYPNDYNLNTAPIGGNASGNVQDEQSYIENILRLTVGKKYDGFISSDELGIKTMDKNIILPCGIYARWEKEKYDI